MGTARCHVAVDDTSRLAYVEILDDEKAPTCVALLRRAIARSVDRRLGRKSASDIGHYASHGCLSDRSLGTPVARREASPAFKMGQPAGVDSSRRDRGWSLRRLTLIWTGLTVVTAPIAYGLFLIVTVPVLASLLARILVGEGHHPSTGLAWILGPALLVGVIWFAGRADEVPIEGVISSALVLIATTALVLVRRLNRRHAEPGDIAA